MLLVLALTRRVPHPGEACGQGHCNISACRIGKGIKDSSDPLRLEAYTWNMSDWPCNTAGQWLRPASKLLWPFDVEQHNGTARTSSDEAATAHRACGPVLEPTAGRIRGGTLAAAVPAGPSARCGRALSPGCRTVVARRRPLERPAAGRSEQVHARPLLPRACAPQSQLRAAAPSLRQLADGALPPVQRHRCCWTLSIPSRHAHQKATMHRHIPMRCSA